MNSTDTTNDAAAHARELACIQRKIADILDDAGRRVRELEVALSTKASELEDAITRRRNPVSAADVASAFAECRVNTGELNSRLIDAIERRGHGVFPTPYEPIRSAWAIIGN